MKQSADALHKDTEHAWLVAWAVDAARALLICASLCLISIAAIASTTNLGTGNGNAGGNSTEIAIVHTGDGQDNFGTYHWSYNSVYFSVASAVSASPYTTECLGTVQGGIAVIRVRYSGTGPLPAGPTNLCNIRLSIAATTPSGTYNLPPAGPSGCCGCTSTTCLSSGGQLTVLNPCPIGNPRVAPDSRYVNLGNGIVRDTKTELLWKQCSEGQTGASCTGTASTMNWQTALLTASNSSFAGFNDWRLPNVKELQSLVETGCSGPAINTTIFPNASSLEMWSSTSNTATDAYRVEFTDGPARVLPKSTVAGVRLVRGGL